MYAVIEVQDSGSGVATLTTQFADYESAVNKFHTIMSYAAVSNLRSHGAVMLENCTVCKCDSVIRGIVYAYPRNNITELAEEWLSYDAPSESYEATVITPEHGNIYILEADSTNYNHGAQFKWNGQSYVQI